MLLGNIQMDLDNSEIGYRSWRIFLSGFHWETMHWSTRLYWLHIHECSIRFVAADIYFSNKWTLLINLQYCRIYTIKPNQIKVHSISQHRILYAVSLRPSQLSSSPPETVYHLNSLTHPLVILFCGIFLEISTPCKGIHSNLREYPNWLSARWDTAKLSVHSVAWFPW